VPSHDSYDRERDCRFLHSSDLQFPCSPERQGACLASGPTAALPVPFEGLASGRVVGHVLTVVVLIGWRKTSSQYTHHGDRIYRCESRQLSGRLLASPQKPGPVSGPSEFRFWTTDYSTWTAERDVCWVHSASKDCGLAGPAALLEPPRTDSKKKSIKCASTLDVDGAARVADVDGAARLADVDGAARLARHRVSSWEPAFENRSSRREKNMVLP
jgi:hypothetical protein